MTHVEPHHDQLTPAGDDVRVTLLELQLAQSQHEVAELRALDAAKTQFLANISHDLRTPLSAVITHGEILRDGILGPLSPRQLDSVNGIIGGGRQLLDQVGEILMYARAAANQLTLQATTFPIRDVFDRVCHLNDSLLTKKQIELVIDVEQAIESVTGDREKIAHVIANLVGNAIEFTPPAGWIALRAARVDDHGGGAWRIEVGDSGVGIAPEHHELIFEEFAQVDSTASRSHHGTGLGLTIARKLVELHGGRIWVESALGRGAQFFFTIPLHLPG